MSLQAMFCGPQIGGMHAEESFKGTTWGFWNQCEDNPNCLQGLHVLWIHRLHVFEASR